MQTKFEASFFVSHTPRPKARPRVTAYGTYTPSKTVEFEQAIKDEYLFNYYGKKTDEAIAIAMIFYRKPPDSWSKKKKQEAIERSYDTRRGDIDNFIKCVLDGLNGIAYNDDAQVTVLTAEKRFGYNEGVTINIKEL